VIVIGDAVAAGGFDGVMLVMMELMLTVGKGFLYDYCL